jgi:hypothetical protein
MIDFVFDERYLVEDVVGERSFFGDVVTDIFVESFYGSFLPCRIRMCKESRYILKAGAVRD